ncbi:MAG: hypothetical protein AABW71_00410 [Nanoarchaeota archaeon]
MAIIRITDLVRSVLDSKKERDMKKEIDEFIKYHQERGGSN